MTNAELKEIISEAINTGLREEKVWQAVMKFAQQQEDAERDRGELETRSQASDDELELSSYERELMLNNQEQCYEPSIFIFNNNL